MASPPMVPAASGNQNASLSGPNMNGMKPKVVETTVRKMGVILAFQAFRYACRATSTVCVAGFGCIHSKCRCLR